MSRLSEATYIAREFHRHYERLAPRFGYSTRKVSAVDWEDVPPANRDLMVATVETLLDREIIDAGGRCTPSIRDMREANDEALNET